MVLLAVGVRGFHLLPPWSHTPPAELWGRSYDSRTVLGRVSLVGQFEELIARLKARGFTDDQIAELLADARARREAEAERGHTIDDPEEDPVAALQRRVSDLEELVASILAVKFVSTNGEQGQ